MLIELYNENIISLFDLLLKDKNTGKNILWGTNDYFKYGDEYASNCEITRESLNNLGDKFLELLQPRVTKSKEVQKGRTKARAEVFTPSWICEYMNNYCEKEWSEKNKKKYDSDLKIVKKEFLKFYIDVRKLEITCGEAPFVVSCYDTVSGNIIPLYNRIGFLDKKLTAVCHYIDDMGKWFEMVCRAYESSYGYEYQGDNLFKARLNLIQTFLDYYEKKWGRGFPSDTQLKKISNIVVKNFWQMDGLTYKVPMSDIECKVYNWRSKKNMNIIGEGSMKFDYIVGNPPYQERDGGAQASAVPIYNKFIDESKKISDKMIVIVPARWMTGGKGLDDFRDEMIHDKHIKFLYDFANSKDVFQGVDIKGGVCYFYRDSEYEGECTCFRKTSDGISKSVRYLCEDGDDIFIRENLLINIKNKVGYEEGKSVSRIVSPLKPYGLRGDTMRDTAKYDLPQFSDVSFDDGYTILGLIDGRNRGYKYIPKDYPIPRKDGLDKYKLFVPRAYGCGNIGEVPSTPVLGTPVLGTPDMLCTETFLQIGPFDTEKEVKNLLTYFKTKFFRTLVSIKKQTQDASSRVYKYVPLQDFTENSDIDWSKSISEIDQQLYKKYGLDEKEIEFIEEKIKEME